MPAECDAAGRGVDEHEQHVDSEDDSQAVFGERQMSATIEDAGGDSADEKFGAEKREFAVLEDARHEGVSLGGDIHANPKQGQLRIKQVECEQQKAFGQPTHGNLARQTLLNSDPITPKPPEPIGGGGS